MSSRITSVGWSAQRAFCVATFALALGIVTMQAGITNFVNFETAPVHPVALGPDGQRWRCAICRTAAWSCSTLPPACPRPLAAWP